MSTTSSDVQTTQLPLSSPTLQPTQSVSQHATTPSPGPAMRTEPAQTTVRMGETTPSGDEHADAPADDDARGNAHVPVKALPEPPPPEAAAEPTRTPIPTEQVFIPLKEWKQRKLEDIESRVRKAENGAKPRVAHRQRRGQRTRAVCLPDRFRALRFLSRFDVCSARLAIPQQAAHGHVVSRDPGHGVPDSGFHVETAHVTQRSQETKYWASARHVYQGDSASTNGSVNVPETPVASTEVGSRDKYGQVDRSSNAANRASVADPLSDSEQVETPSNRQDELTGQVEHGTRSGSRLVIPKVLPNVIPNVFPKVEELVKSLKEASIALSSPTASVPKPFEPNDSNSERLASRNISLANSASNESRKAHRNIPTAVPAAVVEKEQQAGTDDVRKVTSSSTEEFDLDDAQLLDAVVDHGSLLSVKEKPFNFASIDAGARVLAFSGGVMGAKNAIEGSDDKYLLAPCAGAGIGGSRWVDLELSEEIILESVETGNFEYYSSSPRKVAILRSSSYPPKKWTILGVFDFANDKSLQKLRIEKRGVTRYLRVMFAGKQGVEYYCPISTIRAFGKSLLADWKDELDKPSVSQKKNGDVKSASKLARDSDTAKQGTVKPDGKGSVTSGTRPEASSESRSICEQSPCAKFRVPEGGDVRRSHDGTEAENVKPSRVNKLVPETHTRDTKATIEEAPQEGRAGSSAEPASESETTKRSEELPPSSKNDTNGEMEDTEDDGTSPSGSKHDEDGESVSEDDQIVMDALRSDTLAPVDGDDNIFRKVTRMIRLLELNQTLTNQYIDTQLSKFARALSSAHSKSDLATERVQTTERRMELLIVRLESRVEELRAGSFRRDVLLCLLLVCLAFLLGSHWILWTAISGTRLHDEVHTRGVLSDGDGDRIDHLLGTDEASQSLVTRMDGTASEGPSPSGRRKKRRGKKSFVAETLPNEGASGSKPPLLNGFAGKTHGAGFSGRRDGRSVSSFELPSVSTGTNFGQRGGAFDVLERSVER